MDKLKNKYRNEFEKVFLNYIEECEKKLDDSKRQSDDTIVDLLNINEALENKVKELMLENERLSKSCLKKNNQIDKLEEEVKEKRTDCIVLELKVEEYEEELKKYEGQATVNLKEKNIEKIDSKEKNIEREKEQNITDDDIKKLLEAMTNGEVKEEDAKEEERRENKVFKLINEKIDDIFIKFNKENIYGSDIKVLGDKLKEILSYRHIYFERFSRNEICILGILSILANKFDAFKNKYKHLEEMPEYNYLERFDMILRSERITTNRNRSRSDGSAIEYFYENIKGNIEIEEKKLRVIEKLLKVECREVADRVVYAKGENLKCKNDNSNLSNEGVFIVCEDKNSEKAYVYNCWGGYCKECRTVYISETELRWLSEHCKGIKIEVFKELPQKAMDAYSKGKKILTKKYIDEIYSKNIKIKKKEICENIIFISTVIYENEYSKIIELIDRLSKTPEEGKSYKEMLKWIYLGEHEKKLYDDINKLKLSNKLEEEIKILFMKKKKLREEREESKKGVEEKKIIVDRGGQRNLIQKMNNRVLKESGALQSKQVVQILDGMELKEESDIKKIGYSTGLSDIQRRKILREKAIPNMGRAKVISHLKWLVKMNKGRKVMQNAVAIWESDIRALER